LKSCLCVGKVFNGLFYDLYGWLSNSFKEKMEKYFEIFSNIVLIYLLFHLQMTNIASKHLQVDNKFYFLNFGKLLHFSHKCKENNALDRFFSKFFYK